MTDTMAGWIILGTIVIANAWIHVGLQLNLLRKLDKMEDRLMAMSEAYPHQAMLELQRQAFEASQHQPQVPVDRHPDWQQEAAS